MERRKKEQEEELLPRLYREVGGERGSRKHIQTLQD